MNAADIALFSAEPWFLVPRGIVDMEQVSLRPGAIIRESVDAIQIVLGREPFPWVRALFVVEHAPGTE